ncbi:DUF6516 family protein [Erwinia tracheiphila]|uniref:Uncharacterized protein n=2 Tax=Erwinia tracheiphila TaxID=65700 RepID=A0A345CUF1_9GAMM|nr:DUF6516 family protein [Erwinia tracheiphila]AXF77068.1 hypothetical protein AV903_15275 [Erwinia tracheiphila]UIA84248.1 DUF6516 family protein [Erwinia tracheiphila]UIA92828.1 DUF6516 family protein [Erwinia tracheiphila]
MPAKLLMKEILQVTPDSKAELVIWEVDPAVKTSNHKYKYRLAYIVSNTCVVRYDNEAGKGDHKHIGDTEVKTIFTAVQQLLKDFWTDVKIFQR